MATNSHFRPFQSRRGKIITIEIWLYKALISLLWSGFKISMKDTIQGSKWPSMRFYLKNCHFGPFQSLALRRESFDLQPWLRKSLVLSSVDKGAILA